MSDLTVRQAAAEFGVSPHTVYKLLRVGSLRGYKVGGLWRIRPHAIERAKTPVEPPARPPEVRPRVRAQSVRALPGWDKFASR